MKKFLSMAMSLALALAMCFGIPAAIADDGVAGSDEYGGREAVANDGMIPVSGDQLPDGTYNIDVISDSGMFNIVNCVLKVKDGNMTATVTLSGDGYDFLYMGTGEEAVKAGTAAYSGYKENSDGKYEYTVEVSALNEGIPCAAFSHRKQQWYDHTIVFSPAKIDKDILPAGTYCAESTDPFNGAGYIDLEDGTYTMDVEFAGGSGKASINSPAKLTVKDKCASAELEWSSDGYDYLVVNGYKYPKTNTEGNSKFEIPVLCYDKPMDIIGDTTKMSTPHEIDYTLTFKKDTAKAAGSLGGSTLWIIIGIVVIAVIVVAALLVRKSRKKKASDLPMTAAAAEEAVEEAAADAADAVEAVEEKVEEIAETAENAAAEAEEAAEEVAEIATDVADDAAEAIEEN
ncbi:MAG: hypothetical protein K6G78_00300 [bacterium]|nr:hypothetical protein [bacterium]